MASQLRAACVILLMLTLITGVIYPVLVTLVAQTAFPFQANGSVIERNGERVGSELLGQHFDDVKFFWSRPSATSPTPYDGAASSGSNLGPTNPDHLEAVKKRIETLRQAHPDQTGPVPVDLVTTSASGLDPHVSLAAAEYQVARVAKARGMSVDRVRQLVAAHTEDRSLGVLGEPRVHVLRLNLALRESERGP